MEAFIVLASGICALVGVNLANWGNQPAERDRREIEQATHDRKALAKALGYER